MMRNVLTLGAANAVDAAVQLLTPIVLVRLLDESAFGEYRLLWLAAGTLLAIVPFGLPSSLSYYLPRHGRDVQAVFVRQTLLYLALAGVAAGALLSPWNPWLPASLQTLSAAHQAAPLFWSLWVLGHALDVLPAAERRFNLQAGVVLGLALARGAAVVAAAALGGIEAVIAVLAALALAKVVLLLGLAGARYGGALWRPTVPRLAEHARYALPVGAGTAVYMLRMQADQWLVVVLFGAVAYGVYSLGALVLSITGILRTTVNGVIFPEMSRLQADGNLPEVRALNNRSNIVCALVIAPVCAFLFAAATPLVHLLYTETYGEAVPVLRLNVIAYLVASVEVSTVMLVLRQGPFLLYTSIAFLGLSLAVSAAGALAWGMPGAATGSIVANLVAILVLYQRTSRLLRIPVAALQDWGTLARIAAASAAAGLAAWAVVRGGAGALGPAAALVAAAAGFTALYPVCLLLAGLAPLVVDVCGLPPGWLRPLRKLPGRHGT